MRLSLVVVVIVCLGPVALLAQTVTPGDSASNIRFVDSRLGVILIDGMRRSPTLRRLVEEVESRDVIVYFVSKPSLKGGLLGSVTWIGASDNARFVRATFKARPKSNALIATLGHELQHVVEVGNAQWVRDDVLLQEFYRKVGTRTGTAEDVWDSQLARLTGEQVLRELNGVAHTTNAVAADDADR